MALKRRQLLAAAGAGALAGAGQGARELSRTYHIPISNTAGAVLLLEPA